MWTSFTTISGKFRLSPKDKCNTDIIYKGIMYLSLDCGIIWSYVGDKYPQIGTWIWCFEDSNQIISYINSLWEYGIIPIMYSEGVDMELVDKILSYFIIPPPTIIGLTLEALHQIIMDSWIINTREVSLSRLSIPHMGYKIIPDPHIYKIGPHTNIEAKHNITDIKLQSKPLNIAPHLLILMGQPGCDIYDICKFYINNGWIIINEAKAGCIRRSTCSSVATKFGDLIAKIGISIKGVIIACPNPKQSQRNIYIQIAKNANIPYKVGWITKPGWFNYRKKQIIPELLTIYTSNLELPNMSENAFRLI